MRTGKKKAKVACLKEKRKHFSKALLASSDNYPPYLSRAKARRKNGKLVPNYISLILIKPFNNVPGASYHQFRPRWYDCTYMNLNDVPSSTGLRSRRLIERLWQHDAVLDYYGRRLATCSSDKTIKIFEVEGENHKLIETLRGYERLLTLVHVPCALTLSSRHEGAVWCVSWVRSPPFLRKPTLFWPFE